MTAIPESIKVALVGNPNSGKSSLFNILTALRQSVSNFPGVTVEKKIGASILDNGQKITLIDLPGLYSLHPNSRDEKVVVDILTDTRNESYPDLIIYIADASNLERHLLLASQIIDLNIPMIFALNMIDIVEERKQKLDIVPLEKYLSVPVIPISGRNARNIEALKYQIQRFATGEKDAFLSQNKIYAIPPDVQPMLDEIVEKTSINNTYLAKIIAHHHEWMKHIPQQEKETIHWTAARSKFDNIKHQINETMSRYASFSAVARKTVVASKNVDRSFTDKIDNVITHRFWGPIIFFLIMFFTFQTIFAWAEAPMNWIDGFFATAGNFTRSIMPESWFTDLLVDGVIAGLGGILIFIPQITLLFLIISILEETGYMSRAVFMFDGLMQKFGLNGRSIVALVSSGACAIPAIMSTRTISSWKERLNTILVAPLISCSARIPVYTILIAFAVPKGTVLGIFNQQGLAFMSLYLLGIVGAMGSSMVFNKLLNVEKDNSFLMIELPQYKQPMWRNALLNVKEKVTAFVVEAGKVILVISIALWFLASYGPSKSMQNAQTDAEAYITMNNLPTDEAEDYIAGKKIEASYAGHLGKFIEPVIRPLGFDWKIGIALITSFAAREVFVGTMATIYSVGSADDESTISQRMATEINPATGEKVYNPATAWSLLIFYVFAMQCMSTLAIVRRETMSWKWPIIQFLYMSGLAYICSLIVYQVLS